MVTINEIKELNYREKQKLYKQILEPPNAKSYENKIVNLKGMVLEQRLIKNIQLIDINFKTDKQIINELTNQLTKMENNLRKMQLESGEQRRLKRKLIKVTAQRNKSERRVQKLKFLLKQNVKKPVVSEEPKITLYEGELIKPTKLKTAEPKITLHKPETVKVLKPKKLQEAMAVSEEPKITLHEAELVKPETAKVLEPKKLKEAKVVSKEAKLVKPEPKELKGELETSTFKIDETSYKVSFYESVKQKDDEVLAKNPRLFPPVNIQKTEELIKWSIQQGYGDDYSYTPYKINGIKGSCMRSKVLYRFHFYTKLQKKLDTFLSKLARDIKNDMNFP